MRADRGRRDWKTPVASVTVLSAAMRAAGRRLFVVLVATGDMPHELPQPRRQIVGQLAVVLSQEPRHGFAPLG